MLISKKHGFIFVHNPKAGGTAIRTVLGKFCEEPNRFWHQRKSPLSWEKRTFDQAHLSVRDAIDYGFVKKEEVQDIKYWLTCVRDPIDRFLSAFDEHCRQHGRTGVDVNDFIQREMTFDSIEFDWRYVHFRSQVEMVRVPYQAKYFVMHHETFKDNWQHACEQIFGDAYNEEDFALPTTRVRPDSSNKPTVDMLTEESLQRLTLLYLEDYLAFLYKPRVESLELPNEHWARIEAIWRDAHRNALLFTGAHLPPPLNTADKEKNISLLTVGQRAAYKNALIQGGWGNV